jgi:hypothetical protein
MGLPFYGGGSSMGTTFNGSGSSMGMSPGMGTSFNGSGSSMGMSPGMGTSFNGSGSSMGLPFNGSGSSMGLPFNGSGSSLGLPFYGGGSSMGVSPGMGTSFNESGSSLGLPFNGGGSSMGMSPGMGLPFNGSGSSMGLPFNGGLRNKYNRQPGPRDTDPNDIYHRGDGTDFKASPIPKTARTPSDIPPEILTPGTTLAEVESAYKQRRSSAVSKNRPSLVKALDTSFAIRKKKFEDSAREYHTPAGKMKQLKNIPPEQLLPGGTLEDVNEAYDTRRAAASAKGRKALVDALDKSIIIRRKQMAGQKTPTSPEKTSSELKKLRQMKNIPPEKLLPGITLAEIHAAYDARRAAAVTRGRMALVQALDRALAIRKQHMTDQASTKSSAILQGGSVAMVPPEKLIPGATLEDIKTAYDTRRAAAMSKGRAALVNAMDRAIVVRRKQLSKSYLPPGQDWKKVFGPIDAKDPNPRLVSEKYHSLRSKVSEGDVSKLNALFKQAIIDIKMLKRKKLQQILDSSRIPSPSSMTRSAERSAKTARSAERSAKTARSAERSAKTARSAERSAKMARSAERSAKMARSAERSAKMARSAERSAKMARSAERSAKLARSAERSAKLARSAERSAKTARSAERSAKMARSAERSAKTTRSAERSAEMARSAERSARMARSAERSAKTTRSAERSAEMARSAERSARMARSAERSAKMERSAERSAKTRSRRH